ncbi:MAG: outer membrane protein assembly factor BamC [Oxalobacteraceae bacterium]|nr:MAG: outer membrane protein assembly factor BamC [Oxalobacteraceae bacterium]
MTLRKITHMAERSTVQRGILTALALASLAGCGSINSSFGTLLEPSRIDYKSASSSTGKTKSLEVPPDLTQLQRDSRYALPDSANRGVATASGFNAQAAVPASAAANTAAPVAAKVTDEARVVRDGSQRWLVVKMAPEVLWPQVKEFWQDSGFLIATENQETGVMETDWAENRAKIPEGFLRNTLGRALDSFYSTGERDKFRTRLERGADGTTEVYISHRGAQEVLTGLEKERTVWTPRPADPELEAEFLSRLLARLGVEKTRAQAVVANAAPVEQSRARLSRASTGGVVEVDEPFERAWRRVGLALDRVGFTVEDRDRTKGVYYVRYVDQNQDANGKAAEQGFFSRMFSSSKDDKAKAAQRYQIAVRSATAGSQVTVLNSDGAPETSQTANRILSLLTEQLK